MPTPTYTPLANITLGSAAATITFSSIPATYRDLVLVVEAGGSTNLVGRLRLNNDTGTNYHFQRLSASGSATASNQLSARLADFTQATTTSKALMIAHIMDYSATDKTKIILSRADNAQQATEAFVNRWGLLAAVTSVRVLTDTGNWSAGSTFALYGIVA
jgi:hypothetical protein